MDCLLIESKDPEDLLLEHRIVDSNAAARKLDSVDDAVIGASANLKGTVADVAQILWPGRREGVMAVGQLALIVLFEQIHGIDPKRAPLVVPDQVAAPRDLTPEQAHYGLGLSAAV